MSTDPAQPVDHAWIDDQAGVLSCVAGDEHSPGQWTVCPYYLRHDLALALARRIGPGFPGQAAARAVPAPSLQRHGVPYVKITRLAAPAEWAGLVRALPARHGLRPLAWSLFSGLDAHDGLRVLDPRDAYTSALRSAGDRSPAGGRCVAALTELAARVGDPGNCEGRLGLTGSAALDPARLGHPRPVGDVDVIAYPPVTAAGLADAVTGMGGRTLAELATGRDPRPAGYLTGRLMPPVTDPATTRALLRRRTDVAWLGELRLDLTIGTGRPLPVDRLPYADPPAGPRTGVGVVAAVHPGYPVRLDLAAADQPAAAGHLLVTARAFQSILRPGDRLRYTGAAHTDPAGRRFVSIDDAAGHRLTLKPTEETP